MTVQDRTAADADNQRRQPRYHFDRHTPEYRDQFEAITEEMLAKCPIAWTDTYGGHWVAAGNREVFELARCPYVSNDHDLTGERPAYQGISIPRLDAPAASGAGCWRWTIPSTVFTETC
ncbi:cytochrome P450 family protein [Mycobacterium xenopi 4042]|uniref:Cytochrome P450 family protein n=1 Tax=Mycobacterium xenopi 4042 TaxID=1299334 RepID=X8AHM1_MYCXE|nr:cytochrome P450 family protein [Mycobacterium xenopi 4042]